VRYGVFCGPYVASHTPPWRKQRASTIVSPQGARMTFGSWRNVRARLVHIFGAWLSSGDPG